MGKSSIAFVALLALCGLAAVSAGVVDFSDDNAGDEVALRERRDADGDNDCEPKLFKSLKACCTVPEIIPEATFGKCMPKKQGKGKHSTNDKKKKKAKADAAVVPEAAEAAPKTKRSAGDEKCGGDCVLAGFLTANGDLDIAAVSAKFSASAAAGTDAAAWQAVFDPAVTACQAQLGAGPAKDAGKTKCKAGPGQVMRCIAKALYSNCPASASVAGATCDASIAAVKKCDAFAVEKRGGPPAGAEAAAGGAAAAPGAQKKKAHKVKIAKKEKKD